MTDIEITPYVDPNSVGGASPFLQVPDTTKGAVPQPGINAYIQIPGATQSQIQDKADGLQKAITDQLDRVTIEAPGDVNIDPVGNVTVSGTQTVFDGPNYPIKSVEWRYSVDEGFRMTITAQNPPVADVLGQPPDGGSDG
jgi:hypothetical protein